MRNEDEAALMIEKGANWMIKMIAVMFVASLAALAIGCKNPLGDQTKTIKANGPTTYGPYINAAGTTTCSPPADYVIPGRTFDPSVTLNPPIGGGTQYYVSATGDNANDGSSEHPFRSIQRGMNALTSGGDTLSIHGGLYREHPVRQSTDAPNGNPIIVRPYGDGEVFIDGSYDLPSSSWTGIGGNIFSAHVDAVTAVVIDNQPLYKELSLAALRAGPTVSGVPANYRYYYDQVALVLYVTTVDGLNPGTHDTGVIPYFNFSDTPGEQNGFMLWQCNNWSIYGLTVRFMGGRGLEVYNCENAHIEGNKVIFNAHTGLTTLVDHPEAPPLGHDGSNAHVIKNFVYFNFMHNWPRSWPYGSWGTGIGIQGTPYALVEGNISLKNGGEGILAYLGRGGTTFRNNVSVDNWSMLYYYDGCPDGLIEGNVAISHTPNPSDWYNNGFSPPSFGYNKVVQLSQACGIVTANELLPVALNNVIIRNNVIINARMGYTHLTETPTQFYPGGSGIKNVQFLNNTIIVPIRSSEQSDLEIFIVGINIPYNLGNNSASFFENNIIMGGNNGTYAMAYGSADIQTVPAEGLFLGVTIDHNLVYTPLNATPYLWNGGTWGTAYTHTQWLALAGGMGHGNGDVLADPNLSNSATDTAWDKKALAGSPAINAGLASSTVTTDFEGTSRPQGSGWDIGAFESSGL